MILHAVYFDPCDDPEELRSIMTGLADLVGQIDGFLEFSHGPNIDAEGKSSEASYGFVCTFATARALATYAQDARHRALGARLVAMCGGAEAIKVYDIDTID
ncbi:Dabb family protein [Pseudooctadecabacter jejudonensis]|uniref:Stress responsive A/B Barrel Domain protein n=1 Tax=Pseudooctadecabacter jejudonensis TaxID=1391910 RepID=A0A1Y5RZX1_9RHOB|nr:Dabb family protein [Pseudooctadecabacter jejudonensis]SLN29288.1 Stress responsive A/B Barrel Domain protein [Pseudooctadecabacter jejudonensis]